MILKYDLESKSEHELCQKLLKIANIINGWSLTEQQIDIMTYYIRLGYSKETRDIIFNSGKVGSMDTLYTQNYELRNKKLLKDNQKNKNKKTLSKDMQNIKEFLQKKRRGLLIEVDH